MLQYMWSHLTKHFFPESVTHDILLPYWNKAVLDYQKEHHGNLIPSEFIYSLLLLLLLTYQYLSDGYKPTLPADDRWPS
jgi:hypothetical protein